MRSDVKGKELFGFSKTVSHIASGNLNSSVVRQVNINIVVIKRTVFRFVKYS
jgi:hypothetical protein